MTFVCTIPLSEPLEISTITNGSDYVATAVVGYNDATDEVISAFLALSPVPACFGEREIAFCIIESGLDGELRMWDGEDTKPLITEPEDRQIILQAVCSMLRLLIREHAPPILRMFTHTPHLPEPAMLKYMMILEATRLEGYTVTPADTYHGRHMWTMERVT